MSMPTQGEFFPDFILAAFDSAAARHDRPLVVVVWKTGCSTSRMSLPFFDRLQNLYPSALVVGVAQEQEVDLEAYVESNGIAFKQLADSDLRVTRQFSVEYVPAYWLTDASGLVLQAGSAWSRSNMGDFSEQLARLTNVPLKEFFTEADVVPAMQPG